MPWKRLDPCDKSDEVLHQVGGASGQPLERLLQVFTENHKIGDVVLINDGGLEVLQPLAQQGGQHGQIGLRGQSLPRRLKSTVQRVSTGRHILAAQEVPVCS